ncbi:MAG: hypothetical protein AAGH73_05315 [Pseudomonadota bacterium]
MGVSGSMKFGDTARKLAMAGGTFAVAMGVGFFMQQREADAALTQMQPATMAPAPVRAAALQIPEMPSEPKLDASDSALIDVAAEIKENGTAPVVGAAFASADGMTPSLDIVPMDMPSADVSLEIPATAAEADCSQTMTAAARDAALVALSLSAPCAANADFTVHHEGMMFTARTDDAGKATVIAPALSEEAVFIAEFADGTGPVGSATVLDLAGFDRVVVQWHGAADFELHALEAGATYGEVGHVWLEAPGSAALAAQGAGGFLLTMGDARTAEPRFAQVYTYPRSATETVGGVALSVETEITATNCATDVAAQTLGRMGGTEGVRIVDLMLAVPDCDAIGDFLVLRNVLPDLKVSRL